MAKTELTGLWKTEESNRRLKAILEKMNIRETLKKFIVGLVIFEEEVQYMMDYIAKNPTATEDELKAEVCRKAKEVTKKLGMTATERDRYRG